MQSILSEMVDKVLENLNKNEMETLHFFTAEEAKREVLKRISPVAKVGVGGSITLREMGLLGDLRERGNEVYDHWKVGLSKEERQAVGKKQQRADFFSPVPTP